MTVIESPENAGHPRDDAPLPYWMNRPCPSWCTIAHKDEDTCEDRVHMSEMRRLGLVLEDPPEVEVDGKVLDDGPAALSVSMWQHYRERAPYIAVIRNDVAVSRCEVAEADELASLLLDAADLGEKAEEAPLTNARPSWQSLPCPAWCTFTHDETDIQLDRVHADDPQRVTLTMENPEAMPGKQWRPRTASVSLLQGWREREPCVSLLFLGQFTHLTLSEARELAGALTGFVQEANDEAPDAPESTA